MSDTILINKVHNQRLFLNFDTLNDYCDYLLHIQETKLLTICYITKLFLFIFGQVA